MKIKKIKIEVSREFSPHRYIYNLSEVESECDFRINIFYNNSRYFLFYSGIFKKRSLKKNTWLIELILRNEDKSKENPDKSPLRILENVTKEKGRYKYEELYVSAYLMRRLLKQSTNPESFKELKIYYEN